MSKSNTPPPPITATTAVVDVQKPKKPRKSRAKPKAEPVTAPSPVSVQPVFTRAVYYADSKGEVLSSEDPSSVFNYGAGVITRIDNCIANIIRTIHYDPALIDMSCVFDDALLTGMENEVRQLYQKPSWLDVITFNTPRRNLQRWVKQNDMSVIGALFSKYFHAFEADISTVSKMERKIEMLLNEIDTYEPVLTEVAQHLAELAKWKSIDSSFAVAASDRLHSINTIRNMLSMPNMRACSNILRDTVSRIVDANSKYTSELVQLDSTLVGLTVNDGKSLEILLEQFDVHSSKVRQHASTVIHGLINIRNMVSSNGSITQEVSYWSRGLTTMSM